MASVAVQEDDDDEHSYPADVPEDQDDNNDYNDNVWGGFWSGLGSEEVEMVMPTQPYRDHPPDDMQHGTNTQAESNHNSNYTSNRPSMTDIIIITEEI
jgi:hypothetical protein